MTTNDGRTSDGYTHEEVERSRAGLCITCGTPLPEDAGPSRLCCDRRCLRRRAKALAREERASADARRCARCGATMADRRQDARACSEACRKALRRLAAKANG